jgi:hypothetical protein
LPAPFLYDHRFEFAVTPEAFWSTISRTDSFPGWWSWLREFDSEGLRDGAHTDCTIQAPLPYALHVGIDVERVVPNERVDTHVTGDLDGPARLEIAPIASGCAARLVWLLDLREPRLRRFARVARPVLGWAHDRVIAIGVRQFERVALNDAPPR